MITVRRKVWPPAHLLPRAALTHHCQFRRLQEKKKEIYFCKFWWRPESSIKKAQIKVTTDCGQWRLWDKICPLPLLASPWGKSLCLSYCTCVCMCIQMCEWCVSMLGVPSTKLCCIYLFACLLRDRSLTVSGAPWVPQTSPWDSRQSLQPWDYTATTFSFSITVRNSASGPQACTP